MIIFQYIQIRSIIFMIPIRKTITNILKNDLDSDAVYVLLSAGVDSQSVLFSCLELGKKVIAVSFTREDHYSRDYLCAKIIAEQLNLEFISVPIPTDMHTISKSILLLAKEYDCQLKTDFECMYPMIMAYEAIKKHAKKNDNININITSGLGADIYFLLNKRAAINYRGRPDVYRDLLYFNPHYSQRSKHEQLCKKEKFNHVMPYFKNEVYDLFRGKTKKEINSPLEKNDIREQYKNELIDNLYFKHTSFQKGDSGISNMFEVLLDSEWNINDWRSVTGIYNAVKKGAINKPLSINGLLIE